MRNDSPPAADTDVAARLRVAIARLARQLRRHAVAGLTPSQLSALTSVDRLGPLRLGDLAEREQVAPATLTRIVANLVDTGLLERHADPDDGRCWRVAITPAGAAALEAVRTEATAMLAVRIAALDSSGREQLSAALPVLERLIEAPR